MPINQGFWGSFGFSGGLVEHNSCIVLGMLRMASYLQGPVLHHIFFARKVFVVKAAVLLVFRVLHVVFLW